MVGNVAQVSDQIGAAFGGNASTREQGIACDRRTADRGRWLIKPRQLSRVVLPQRFHVHDFLQSEETH